MKNLAVISSLLLTTVLLSSCLGDKIIPNGEKSNTINKNELTYVDYSPENLEKSSGNIVLFFHSKSCGSCKKTDINLKENILPEGLTVLKLEYDEYRDIQQKYGITNWHNFVQVDNKGNMLKKWAGSFTADDIVSELVSSEENIAETKIVEQENEVIKSEGVYIDYSASEVENSSGNIVLFFHSKSCGSCKKTDINLTENILPEGLTVLKLEYDEYRDIQQKYGITHWHNFVQVDNKGNMLKKWAGSFTADDIVSELVSSEENIDEQENVIAEEKITE